MMNQRTCHVGQKLVFVTKHRPRSDDSGRRECSFHSLLTLSLGLVEFGIRSGRSVQMRNMYKPGNARLRSN